MTNRLSVNSAHLAQLQGAAAGVRGIEFRGTLPNARIAEVIDGIYVLIVPSLWFENTPLVLYSALASRTPVIASDFPGKAEAVEHGLNGLLFPAGDATVLASRLSTLLEQPDLLTRLSQACERPKGVVESTTEVLSLWSEERTPGQASWSTRHTIEPLKFRRGDSCIVGWTVAEMKAPKSITVFRAGGFLSSTQCFTARPDVRDGLRAAGNAVDDESIGFELVFFPHEDRSRIEVGITAPSGTETRFMLADCAKGTSVQVVGGGLLGLDNESLMSTGGAPASANALGSLESDRSAMKAER